METTPVHFLRAETHLRSDGEINFCGYFSSQNVHALEIFDRDTRLYLLISFKKFIDCFFL